MRRPSTTASDYYHEQLIESSSSASYSKWDDNHAWSSQEWMLRCASDQSIVNEAQPRDRTVQPVVIPQRGARPQQFVIGNDETESELSVESRSFLNRVNDQVRKRQKQTIFDEWYRKRRKTFYDMENVHVCNIGISSIHGKELHGQLSFHHEYKRSHIETHVRHIYKISVRTR